MEIQTEKNPTSSLVPCRRRSSAAPFGVYVTTAAFNSTRQLPKHSIGAKELAPRLLTF